MPKNGPWGPWGRMVNHEPVDFGIISDFLDKPISGICVDYALME